MRTRLLLSGLVLFGAACAPLAAADEIEAVEKQIIAAWDKLQTLSGKMTASMEMAGEGFSMKSTQTGTHEMVRKGETLLYRMESESISATTMQGTENKQTSKSLMVCDGQHIYSLTETDGQKSANKMKVDHSMMDVKSFLTQMRKDYVLKLMPEEAVEGQACFVIEASPKEGGAISMGMGKMVVYYAKEFGFPLKTVMYTPDNKPMNTMTYTDVKVNQPIDPARFVFTPPADVKVEDLTNMGDHGKAPEAQPQTPSEPGKP